MGLCAIYYSVFGLAVFNTLVIEFCHICSALFQDGSGILEPRVLVTGSVLREDFEKCCYGTLGEKNSGIRTKDVTLPVSFSQFPIIFVNAGIYALSVIFGHQV